jgi:hypothetical protein
MEVIGMSLDRDFWESNPCCKGSTKWNPRDKVVVEGDEVRYLLWGSQVATWNRKNNTIMVDDCGWTTKLTFNRLNAILSEVHLSIYSSRGKSYIWSSKRGTEYVWEGTHTINLDTRKITPCTPRKTNKKVSEALRSYYASAAELIEKRKRLVIKTLDGFVCLYPRRYYSREFSMLVLGLYASSGNIKAYMGKVASSKVCSAFMKNDASSLTGYLAQNGEELSDREMLSELDDFRVDASLLPQPILQQLALMKLMEA